MRTFKGSFKTCAHRVAFWYDVDGIRMTTEMKEDLSGAAERRARECIIDGYVEGELCFFVEGRGRRGDREVRGGWSIEKK